MLGIAPLTWTVFIWPWSELVNIIIHLLVQCVLSKLEGSWHLSLLRICCDSYASFICQSKSWQSIRHVLPLLCFQSLNLIIHRTQHKPAWANAAHVQVHSYTRTQFLLFLSGGVRVGQGVHDWCISQSGGLFRWVTSCTNNDTWWKPLSLSHDRKWRWIVSRIGSDFVLQELRNIFVVLILHNNHLQCSILKY